MAGKQKRVTVTLDTLGCKLNQADTELLARQFVDAGYCLISAVDEADIYILNTCTVTHMADRKSRQRLRLARRRNPSALVVATGCYAERAPEEIIGIGGVDVIAGNKQKKLLVGMVREFGKISGSVPVQRYPAANLRTRTFTKVQDGCNGFCSYCIVPLVRGRERSMPADLIVAEVRERVSNGYKEVVFTGTKPGSYSDGWVDLAGLLRRILAETGVGRLRFSSLQPQEISNELIGLWSDGRLCSHFHLSLQSGSDRVLERMKRCYSVSDYRRAVSLLREAVPEAAITTDVIVGFPGETAEEFEQSFEVCRQTGFARIHIFPYSPRPSTEAAWMPQPVGERAKRERIGRMLALARESTRAFNRRFLDRIVTVLWEKQSDGVWSGLTDNYIKVYTKSSGDLTNKVLPVKLVAVRGEGLLGKLVD